MSAPQHLGADRTRAKIAATLDALAALALRFGDGNLALSTIHARELCAPGAALDVELTAAHANTLAAALLEAAREPRHTPVDAVELLALAGTLASCVYEVADLAGRDAR